MAARKAAEEGLRSLPNGMSHLRGLLHLAGKGQLLAEAGMTNKAPGLSGAARIGSKTAIADEA